MYSSVTSCALVGVEPKAVQIETVVTTGSGGFVIVGLPDAAIRESRQRVKAAIREAGFRFPGGNVVVNLSPADLPKVGATYDLPIALSVLAAASETKLTFDAFVPVGELSLHGHVKPVRAALGATVVADRLSKTCMMSSSAVVASLDDAPIAGVSTLRDAVAVAQGRRLPDIVDRPADVVVDGCDMRDVRGQFRARRALEIAAAGRHHLLLIGPPGAGKTMLSRCLPTILPPLEGPEQAEVSLVWAAAGTDREASRLPPFQSPHHSCSMAALVGGGSGLPTPGEVSRAHRGVLFLDELGEFSTQTLDSLRQPIEGRSVSIVRQAGSFRFPSDVQLIAASNPCPCGNLGDRKKPCRCLDGAKARYAAKLSGPLADRFDLRVDMERLSATALMGAGGEPSADVQERVIAARRRQTNRGALNRDLAGRHFDDSAWTDSAISELRIAAEESTISARGWERARRVALTVADLDASEVVESAHVKEALDLRGGLT